MALSQSSLIYEHREVLLKDKPDEMLAASAKGTVPVLVLAERVIDESIDVMRYALDDNHQLELVSLDDELVLQNDEEFKPLLDRYKYFERYPELSQSEHLQKALPYLNALEKRLDEYGGAFLNGAVAQAIDMAIFPFIRQFAFTDKAKFDALDLPNTQAWLKAWLHDERFLKVMPKLPVWQHGDDASFVQLGVVVQHRSDAQSFVIELPEEETAIVRYRYINEGEIDIFTTQVPVSQRGAGLAARLVDVAFFWAEKNQYEIKTSCWYAEKRANSLQR